MNILESALRRIAVRQTQQIFTSTASNIAYSIQSGGVPKPKTWFGITIGVTFLTGFSFVGAFMLALLFGYTFSIIIISGWFALMLKMGYDDITSTQGDLYKSEPVTKSDRRYKYGYKTLGSRMVKSGEKYDLNDKERQMNRVGGWIRMAFAVLLYLGYVVPFILKYVSK